jgi:hypothetical protein
MPKVLIISPRFPPKNTADLHRVRMSLPYYRSFGWEPTVLCLTPETSDGVDDPLLEQSLPRDIEVVRVAAWSEQSCRRFGFGHLDNRCLVPLYLAGTKLLRENQYDVVLFSTTVFMTFLLGPLWRRRFGCKIVYDFQDPWYSGKTKPYTEKTVPGRWWKYRLSQAMASWLEPIAIASADHIISVSEGYQRDLLKRHPKLDTSQFTIMPFPVAKADYDFVRESGVKSDIFSAGDGATHWVYGGRGGPDLVPALTALVEQLAQLRSAEPGFAQKLKLYFVGTNYAPAARTFEVIRPVAERCGVGDMVEEYSQRIPYHQVLSLYNDSDAVLVIGSTSPDYTASKLLSCVLSGKPVLALLHQDSLAAKIAARFPNVFVARFGGGLSDLQFKVAVAEGMQWLRRVKYDVAAIDEEIKPWSAQEQTRLQCSIFDRLTIQPPAGS